MDYQPGQVLGLRDFTVTEKTAVISDCGTYRYDLWRKWAPGRMKRGYVVFIGLNPSTADDKEDDQTIRKCIGFARRWDYDALCMLNLFAVRAREPHDMLVHPAPIGPDNDDWIRMDTAGASMVIAAWGNDGGHKSRDHQVRDLFPRLYCLKRNKDGTPAHPLYLPGHLNPIPL